MLKGLLDTMYLGIIEKSHAVKFSQTIADLTYQKITNLLVKYNFPELSSIEIVTNVVPDEDDDAFIGLCDGDTEGSYEIQIDPEFRPVDRYVIAGAIATQLAHISRELELDEIQKIYDSKSYDTNEDYAREVERYADYLAVLHGCKDYLIAYRKFEEENYEPDPTDGLTLAELNLSVEELAELVHDPIAEIVVKEIFDCQIPTENEPYPDNFDNR